ncbi:hypothetical protein Tco_1100598 [Tanacetum coccineum]
MNVEVGPNTGFVPNIGYVPITVHESPIADNSALIHSGPTSYTKLVTGEPSRKSVNFRTLITPMRNWSDVAIPLESIGAISECSKDGFDAMLENGPCEDGLSIIATKLDTLLMLDSYTPDMCMQSCGRSSYARAMIELCSNCKVFGHVLNEYPKKIVSDMRKNLNNTRQATRGVPVGPKKPLPKVVSMVNADSDSDVEEVFDEHIIFMASTGLKHDSDSGYGTNRLWEHWKETKWDDDYDPYDDDLYDSHDMSDNLQAICDEFDITIHGDLKLQVINEERIEEVKEHAAYKRSQNGGALAWKKGSWDRGERVVVRIKKNKETCVLNEAVTVGKHANVEKHREMIKGKLVLVGDDGIPFKNLNADSQSNVMDHFPCFSDTFGTPNTSNKVATAGTRDTPSTNGEDGSVNVSHPDCSSTGMELMLESRPWLICKVPLDLRKWSPLVNMAKEDLKSVPV